MVSILVAAYNAEKYIMETINSVLKQTYENWELIIVDDGSTDNTRDIVSRQICLDKRIKLISICNQGAAVARNVAFDHSFGTYIVLLDADDNILPDKLSRQIRLLDEYQHVDVVYGDTWICDENMNHICLESKKYPNQHVDGDVFYRLCYGNIMSVHSAMVRRCAITKIGQIHHQTRIQIADWDFWVRLAEKSLFLYHDNPVAEYRIHSAMSAKNDNNKLQVKQREFTFSRIKKLRRFKEIPFFKSSNAYFYMARFCHKFSDTNKAKEYCLLAIKTNVFNFKALVFVLSLWSI